MTASLVAAVYLAPLIAPVVVHAFHEVYHVAEAWRHQAVLAGDHRHDPDEPSSAGRRAHTHGDGEEAHSHAGLVDLLLATEASDHEEATEDDATIPPPFRLVAHLPAIPIIQFASDPGTMSPYLERGRWATTPGLPPPAPPPRV